MATPGVLTSDDATTGVDIDALLRGILFIATFLAAWISFHPFPSLAAPPPTLAEGGDVANQIGFSLIFLVLAGWTYWHEPRRLVLLLRPVLLATLAWCALSVAASWDVTLAARHLAFALVLLSICGMVLLLPKSVRHFSDLLAAVVLIVLVACYLGVALIPHLAIHQATDFLEPEHAGEWRGVFAHKNQAGATMALFIFVGLFVVRMRSVALGAVIIALSAIFLACTESKTAIAVLPLALILAAIVRRTRPWIGAAIVVAVLIVFNLCSVGTVIFEPVHKLVAAFMPDATFTGRTEIWQLGIHAVAQRPITGFGFSSFWGTEQVVYGLGNDTTWANTATDAHNAYLNLAVTIGVPGMLLTVLWIVVLPILDSYRPPRDAFSLPLQTLFLRVCLFGTFGSCFESSIFQQVGEVWFFFLISAFGLRYLSLSRVAA